MRRTLAAAAAIMVLAGVSVYALPSGFVFLRDIAPGIEQDIRYAGSNNFTKRPVPGYAAAECILAKPAAEALARVQQVLEKSNFTLIVYDCYRPARAVRHFVRWATESGPQHDKTYYPRVPRSQLLIQGYIASRSAHSTGSAVDLTIGRKSDAGITVPLNMGGEFDRFDPVSHLSAGNISSEARSNRRWLGQLMQKQGFKGYDREWWHFTFKGGPMPKKPLDFQIPLHE